MLKLFVLSYAIKTLLLGIAWFFIPDLPQRATALVRRVVGWEAPAAAQDAPTVAAPEAATTVASPR
jgi:hypothetical protein